MTPIVVTAVVILAVVISAFTSRQYYEGLKAGHRSHCLEYPKSEYHDCIDETNTGYEDYQRQCKEVVGNQY